MNESDELVEKIVVINLKAAKALGDAAARRLDAAQVPQHTVVTELANYQCPKCGAYDASVAPVPPRCGCGADRPKKTNYWVWLLVAAIALYGFAGEVYRVVNRWPIISVGPTGPLQ